MKAKALFLGAALMMLLALLPPSEFAQSNEDLFYGTWVNEDAAPQKTVHVPGVFMNYALLSDSSPFEQGTVQIISSWKDSEGNVWYKTVSTFTTGSGKGTMDQELQKISKSGTVLEYEWTYVGEYNPSKFPSRVDSSDGRYFIYYRAEK